MNILNKLLNYSVCFYILVLMIFPSKFNIKGIPFYGDVILFLVFGIYLICLIFSKDARKRFIQGLKDFFTDYIGITLFLITALMFISITYTSHPPVAYKDSIRFATFVALFFIVKYEMFNEANISNIINVCMGASVIVSIIGIMQFFGGLNFLEKYYRVYKRAGIPRIGSSLENPNNLGAYAILLLFPMLVLALKEQNKRKRSIYIILSILLSADVIMSGSRNAFMCFAAGVIIIGIIYNRKLLVSFLCAAGIIYFIPGVSTVIKGINDPSQNVSRMKIWETALHMIKDHPILGVGNGDFSRLYLRYIKKYPNLKYYSDNKVPMHPHNAFLKFQCELGVLGTILFVLLLMSVVRGLWLAANNAKRDVHKYFYRGFTLSIIIFIVMNIFDCYLATPKVMANFFIIIAVSQSLYYNLSNNKWNTLEDFYG